MTEDDWSSILPYLYHYHVNFSDQISQLNSTNLSLASIMCQGMCCVLQCWVNLLSWVHIPSPMFLRHLRV